MPDGPELPIDEERLVTLIQTAVTAAVRDLSFVMPPLTEKVIYRPTPTGWTSVTLRCPFYRAAEVWDAIDVVWSSMEGTSLVDYLWTRGALKKTLSRDGDIAPDKRDWGRFVWGDLVHSPLLHLLELNLVRELTEAGNCTAWRIDGGELETACREVARQVCQSGRHVVAVCPLMGLHFAAGMTDVELEPGVCIRNVTEEQKRLFLSRFDAEFVDYDFSAWSSRATLEVDRVFPRVDDDTPSTFCAVAVDRLKWAAMLTFNGDAPLLEGPVIIRGPAGWRGRTLRRADVFPGGSVPYHEITPESSKLIGSLVSQLKRAQEIAPELGQAVWHFGRACNATLARDVVLESAIGIEMLLTSGGGETTYKVSVHGLALLAETEGAAVADELASIYSVRSRAAHGSGDIEQKAKRVAPRARNILAKTIGAVVTGVDSGTLDVTSTRGDVGAAVKAFVLRKVAGPPSIDPAPRLIRGSPDPASKAIRRGTNSD